MNQEQIRTSLLIEPKKTPLTYHEKKIKEAAKHLGLDDEGAEVFARGRKE